MVVDAPTGETPVMPAAGSGTAAPVNADPLRTQRTPNGATRPEATRSGATPSEPVPAEPLPAEPLPAEPDRLEPADPATPAEPAASELDPAYDAAADPEPYVAPDDPNTGERTEPFRGPFEPPPGKPTVNDFVPSSREESGESPESPAPRPTTPTIAASAAGDVAALLNGRALDGVLRGPASEEKLEKIKDLYLTVEAIGDDNVGKHFDELMTRQRELISEYFKETGIGKGPRDSTQTDQPSTG
jgi:hypothetical protein